MATDDLNSSIATAEVSATTTALATTALAATVEPRSAGGDTFAETGLAETGLAERRSMRADGGSGEDADEKQRSVGVMEILRSDGYLDPETTGSG